MTYLGICDSPSGHIVVLSNDKATAEKLLYGEWKKRVYPGYAEQNGVRSFKDLNEFVGARVIGNLEFDKAHIWEMIP